MDNYLTWNDFKRLICGSLKNALCINAYMESLFKTQFEQSQFEEKIQNLQKEVLSKFDKIPATLKEMTAFVTIYDEEGTIHFRLDANLFWQNVMLKCSPYPIDKVEYERVSKLFYEGKQEEFIESTKNILKKLKNVCNELIREGKSIVIRDRGIPIGKIDKNALIERRDLATWLIKHLEELILNYSEEIPDSILEHINQDKLLLLTIQSSFEGAGLIFYEEKKLNPRFFPFIQNYYRYIQYRRKENPNFNPNYVVRNSTKFQKTGIITAESVIQLIEKVNELNKEEHLESYGFTSDEAMLTYCLTDLKEKREKEEEEQNRKKRLESFKKDIRLGWELLPVEHKGEGRRRGIFIRSKTDSEKRELEEKREKLLEEKINVFNDLPYITTLRGTNHLEGYIAYVFPNGKVIMEKFYKKTREGLVPTYHEAIFVINIEYFGELSRESKSNIREFIKSGVDPNAKVIHHFKNFKHKVLKVIHHFKNFKHKVLMEIENMEYSEKVLDYIEALVNSTEKNKELVKS